MVDRVDKPDAPNPYRIQSTTETKKDKPHEERAPGQEAKYQQEKRNQEWGKFQADPDLRKTVRVPLGDILQLKFRRASSRQASPTVNADLVWKDGRTTENVSFLLHNLEDFLKIKNMKPGDPIPPSFWTRGKELEVTIPQGRSGSGPWTMPPMEENTASAKQTERPWHAIAIFMGVMDYKTKSWKFSLLFLYGLFLSIVLLLIFKLTGVL